MASIKSISYLGEDLSFELDDANPDNIRLLLLPTVPAALKVQKDEGPVTLFLELKDGTKMHADVKIVVPSVVP